MKKRVLRIVCCLIIILTFIGITKAIPILDDAKIQKYDVNGNEIYNKSGKNSNEIFRKYNEKNQLIETKNVFPDIINKGKKSNYTFYEYVNDLLVKSVYKSDSNPEKEDYEILYEYNPQGLKTKKTHSRKGVTLFEYDNNSNLRTEITPDKKTTYEYDKNGKCIKEESSDGTIREHEYDEKGRLLKTTYINDHFNGNRTVRWEYFDDDPNISVKSYNNGEFASNYMVYDKNDECIETGWKLDDGIAITKYKKITLYTRWKNGQIKSKRVYTLYKKDCFEKK